MSENQEDNKDIVDNAVEYINSATTLEERQQRKLQMHSFIYGMSPTTLNKILNKES